MQQVANVRVRRMRNRLLDFLLWPNATFTTIHIPAVRFTGKTPQFHRPKDDDKREIRSKTMQLEFNSIGHFSFSSKYVSRWKTGFVILSFVAAQIKCLSDNIIALQVRQQQLEIVEARVACGQYENNSTYILWLIKDDAVRYNKVTEANERSSEMGQERAEVGRRRRRRVKCSSGESWRLVLEFGFCLLKCA